MKSAFIFLSLLLFLGCTRQRISGIEPKKGKVSLLLEQSNNKANPTDKLDLLDSALYIAIKKPTDSLLLNMLYKKSNLLYTLKLPDSTFMYDKLLYKKALEINNSKYLASSARNIGVGFKERQIYDSAYYFYNLSKGYEIEMNDSSGIAKNLLSLGKLEKDFNDLHGAKETLTRSISYLNEHSNDYLAEIFDQLGTINRKLRNYKDAIKYHTKALEVSTNLLFKTAYLNNLGLVYLDKKNFKEAEKIFKGLHNDTILSKKSKRYARVLHNLAYTQWKHKNSDPKKKFFDALNIRKKSNDYRGLMASYSGLGEYFSSIKSKTAKEYLDSSILISRKLRMPRGEIESLKLLMDLKPKVGSYKNRYIFLKDSIDEKELEVKTLFAKMKYDDEKEKKRLLVLETESAKQEAQLAQQKTQKVLFISLISILLMGGASLFFILRQRHKKEKLKEIYNTEKRISEELHNGLANDVFGLMTRIQGKKNTTEDVLDRLDTIYQTTRQISHKHSAVKTGPEFKEELQYLIDTYQDENTTIVSKGLSSIDWTVLGDQKCIALHRSLREILTNLRKHANATLVSIQFKKDEKGVHVTYVDNGVGLKNGVQHGIGLAHIKSRMQSVDGRFKIHQNVKAGTKMELVLT